MAAKIKTIVAAKDSKKRIRSLNILQSLYLDSPFIGVYKKRCVSESVFVPAVFFPAW